MPSRSLTWFVMMNGKCVGKVIAASEEEAKAAARREYDKDIEYDPVNVVPRRRKRLKPDPRNNG